MLSHYHCSKKYSGAHYTIERSKNEPDDLILTMIKCGQLILESNMKKQSIRFGRPSAKSKPLSSE
ncbi:MAG: hypothetical protein ACKVJE_02885, partial [Pseudomonadales bacterium]